MPLLGLAVLLAHVAALPVAVGRCHKDELEVRLDETPPGGTGPGLHYTRWRVEYRGGYVREVGAARLVGPFQDPAHPPCGVRLVVGQRFLDEHVAPMVRSGIELQMTGFEQFPVGKFRAVTAVDVRWARFDDTPGDRAVFGQLSGGVIATLADRWHTDGYARVHVAVALEHVDADVVVALVPRVEGTRLTFEIYAHAAVRSGNDAVDWALKTFHADHFATRAVRDQIDDAILQAFDAPPPLELSGGRTLEVAYCEGARLEMRSGAWATLPLALGFTGSPVLPPRLGPVTPPAPAADTVLAFDLDLDTVNALLYELWRTGFLDEELERAGLDRRFDADPRVQDLLTLRISPLRLALPPVVSPGPRGLRMAADLRVALTDRGAVTPARVWGALDLDLDGAGGEVGLAEMELSCEPRPGVLRPCYGDLVAAMRAQAGDTRDELTRVLREILDGLFAGTRVAAPDQPVVLVLGAPRTTAYPAGPSATVRIEVTARIEETP
jgi:hypothetical protein